MLVFLPEAASLHELTTLSCVLPFVGSGTCLAFVPQFVADFAGTLLTVSCGVLRVPSAFLCIGLVCRSRSHRRPSRRILDGSIRPLRVVALAPGVFHRAVGSVGAHGIHLGSTCIALHWPWSVSAVWAFASWGSGWCLLLFPARLSAGVTW